MGQAGIEAQSPEPVGSAALRSSKPPEDPRTIRLGVVFDVLSRDEFAGRGGGMPPLRVLGDSRRRTTVGFLGDYPAEGDEALCEFAEEVHHYGLQACVSGWGKPVVLVREAAPRHSDNAWLRYVVYALLVAYTLAIFLPPFFRYPRPWSEFQYPTQDFWIEFWTIAVFSLFAVGSLMVYLTFYRRMQSTSRDRWGAGVAALIAAIWALVYWRIAIVYLSFDAQAAGCCELVHGHQLWRWAVLDAVPFVSVDGLLGLTRPDHNEGIGVSLLLLAIQVTIIFAVVAVVRVVIKNAWASRSDGAPAGGNHPDADSFTAAWLAPMSSPGSDPDLASRTITCPACHSEVSASSPTCFQCGLERGRVAMPIVDTPLWVRVGGFLFAIAWITLGGMYLLLAGASTFYPEDRGGYLVFAAAMLATSVIYVALVAPTVSYRRRDALLTLIPVYGVMLLGMVAWRRTALPTRYWAARPDESEAAAAGDRMAEARPAIPHGRSLRRSRVGRTLLAISGYTLAFFGVWLLLYAFLALDLIEGALA